MISENGSSFLEFLQDSWSYHDFFMMQDARVILFYTFSISGDNSKLDLAFQLENKRR
jgi:hypothetical protein